MLQGEDSLTWEMDISHNNEDWLVDSRVCRVGQGDGGTDTLLKLADIVAPTFDIIEQEVPPLLKKLYEAGAKILREQISL